MRRWIGRSFWLSAWSFWLWLGFGLHRELPRDLGPAVGRIPTATNDMFSFIKDTHFIAVYPGGFSGEFRVDVHDADTGAVVHRVAFPEYLPKSSEPLCRSHGGFIAEAQGQKLGGLQFVDLKTGQWKRITNIATVDFGVHPTRPWVWFREAGLPRDKPTQLVVVDWNTGRTVARWPDRPPPEGSVDFVEACQFRDHGGDELLILADRLDAERRTTKRLVTWNPTDGSIGKDVPLQADHVEWGSRWGRSGRVALLDWPEGGLGGVSVLDVRTGEVLLSSRSTRGLIRISGTAVAWSPTAISPSGRTLFSMYEELWDIDGRRRIWSPQEFEQVLKTDSSRGKLLVLEDWNNRFAFLQLQLPFGGMTWAVRDMETGALAYRAARSHPEFLHFSSDGKLGVTSDGDIVSFPLRPNWPLLALCQTILALPIVLLWATLRWRRNRRLRLESVQP